MGPQIYIDIQTGTWGDAADLRIISGDLAEMLAILFASDLVPDSEIIRAAQESGLDIPQV